MQGGRRYGIYLLGTMTGTKILIKNMCCPRCVNAIGAILASMNLTAKEIRLGEAVVEETLSEDETELLAAKLREQGFELLDDPNACLVEAIRVAVLEWVRMAEGKPKLSVYVSQKICKDYSSLSKLFSQVRGVTIEHYAIRHRTERAKELLCYSAMTISEIAYRLGYSSPAHFAAQFKQFTGMSPKEFRSLDNRPLVSLDEL